MKKENIEQEIEKTLSSLDELDRAQTDTFFYTRLQAKLHAHHETTLFGVRQLQWILTVLLLLLCVNVFSYINFKSQEGKSMRMGSLESFATNYGWENYNLYEFNQMEK